MIYVFIFTPFADGGGGGGHQPRLPLTRLHAKTSWRGIQALFGCKSLHYGISKLSKPAIF